MQYFAIPFCLGKNFIIFHILKRTKTYSICALFVLYPIFSNTYCIEVVVENKHSIFVKRPKYLNLQIIDLPNPKKGIVVNVADRGYRYIRGKMRF